MGAKRFKSREDAVAHVTKLGWTLVPTPAGHPSYPPIIGDATDNRGRSQRLQFEWRNSTRHTPAQGAGDNYWWTAS